MRKKEISCCFVGHGLKTMPWQNYEEDERYKNLQKLTKIEIEKAINNGYKVFYTNMEKGFGIMCAELVEQLKQKYPQIKLFCYLPFIIKPLNYDEVYFKRFMFVVSMSNKLRYSSQNYFYGCLQKCNKFLIKKSSLIITFFFFFEGITKQAIIYAKSKNLNIKVIIP